MLLGREPTRFRNPLPHEAPHLLGELSVIAFDVELEVQAQASRVPVDRPEQDPIVVHYHELGVIEGSLR